MTKRQPVQTLPFRAGAAALLALAAGAAARAQHSGGRELTVGKHSMVEACAPCHGADGLAHDAEVPNLAGQNAAYLYNQLRAFRSGRRQHKEMLYMSRQSSDEDMRALAEYFSQLPPR
ncbi:c-type cytochrome [Rhodoblastus sp.]|uniref:c-type cytochrome n=1 Tax=Rhodoblastus sp. TaxID=1962975 RepID=UPI003F94EC98